MYQNWLLHYDDCLKSTASDARLINLSCPPRHLRGKARGRWALPTFIRTADWLTTLSYETKQAVSTMVALYYESTYYCSGLWSWNHSTREFFSPHYGRSLILFLKRFYDFTTPIFPRGLKPRKRDLYIFITFPIKTSSSTSVSKK